MDNDLIDMIAAEEPSATDVHDKIKDILYAKSAENIDTIKPAVTASMFGGPNPYLDVPETEVETEPKIDLDQLKDKKKNKVLVKPTDTDTKNDTKTDNQTTFLPLLNKTRTNLKTRTRTRKPFNFKKLPKLPGTGHNVGKRVNPQ